MSPLSDALAISINQVCFDPSTLITPIDEPRVEIAYFDSMEVCALETVEEEEEIFYDALDYLSNLNEAMNTLTSRMKSLNKRVTKLERVEAPSLSNLPPEQNPGRYRGWRFTSRYTPIALSYNQVFDILISRKLIEPLEPMHIPAGIKLPGWNDNVFCRYHQSNSSRNQATRLEWECLLSIPLKQRIFDREVLRL